MKEELGNTDKLEKIIDAIFLLNHNIVSLMVQEAEDSIEGRTSSYNELLEDQSFRKLSEYHAQLRDIVRERLKISDEQHNEEMEEDYTVATREEGRIERQENEKEKIISILEERVKTIFESMNWIPTGIEVDGEITTQESEYVGKPEEAIRAQEYLSLVESMCKQIEIIYFEDFFGELYDEETEPISPYISPLLIDAIADRAGFRLAEKQCENYLKKYKSQEEIFDEYPELRDTTEHVEYLRILERYKRKFETATGYLNENTTYGEYFFELYRNGNLPKYTGFSKTEIDTRINGRTEKCAKRNEAVIQEIFEKSREKYSKFVSKRELKQRTSNIAIRLREISRMPKKMKRKKGNKKVFELKIGGKKIKSKSGRLEDDGR